MIISIQRILLVFVITFYCINSIQAQVKIGANATTVNANSILELEGPGKGVLLPRSNTTEINGMTAVPSGMLVFSTTNSALYLKVDTGWVILNPALQTIASPSYADFFALMPPDNASLVVPGTAVQFPQDGPTSGGGIARTTPSAFNLPDIGTYEVNFNVSVTEAGQLAIALNGVDLAYTVVGRATGTSQITGTSLVTTTSINSILEIRNPAGNPAALTITPLAGGTSPVSSHLSIIKLQ